MGAVKKAFSSVGKLISKGVGSITGANAAQSQAKALASAQAAQQKQEAQYAAQNAQNAAIQAQTAQSTLESQAARDKAIQDAKDLAAAAQSTNDQTVTVDLTSQDGATDETGKRINTRDTYASRTGGGLRI